MSFLKNGLPDFEMALRMSKSSMLPLKPQGLKDLRPCLILPKTIPIHMAIAHYIE